MNNNNLISNPINNPTNNSTNIPINNNINNNINNHIVYSCCYWYGDLLKIHHLFFKSFIKTQPPNFVIDVYIENCKNAGEFLSSYTLHEINRIKIININWNDITIPTLVYHNFNHLRKMNLALLSDYFRFFTLIKYPKYKFYFDMDICFLKSFKDLLGQKCFVYSWGTEFHGNSAIIMRDQNTTRELAYLLFVNKTPHPIVFRFGNPNISIKYCNQFDPQWMTNEFELPFDNNFLSKFRMDDLVIKHNCYCVHWHNHWKVDPEEYNKSWIAGMYDKYVNNSK